MISLIIIAILTMSLIATISMNMLTLGNQTEQVIRTIEEKNDIESIKIALKQELRPVGLNRKLSLPVGTLSSNGYTSLPNSISINTENSWGNDYIYCPYSTTELSGVGNGSIQTSSSSSYNISTIPYEGKGYIIASEQPFIAQYNIIAAVISPIPSTTIPSCEDVRYDSVNKQFYTLNYDGIVEVIREETSIISREPVAIDISSSDTSIRMNEEVSDWDVSLPELYTINLDAGTHLTGNVNFINPLQSKVKQVKIVGSNTGVTQLSSSSPVNMNFENVIVSFENVIINGLISVNLVNSELYLNDVTLKLNSVKDSHVKLQGPASLNTGSKMMINTSVLDLRDHNVEITKQNSNVGIELLSSKMLVDNVSFINNVSGGLGILVGSSSEIMMFGNFGISGTALLSGISLDSNAKLSLNNGGMSSSVTMDTLIFSQGNVDVKNSILTSSPNTNNAIVLGDGAELNLSSSQIGTNVASTSSVVGIVDLGGAKFISGNSTVIRALSTCWSGDIFYQAPSGNGLVSSTTDINYKIANKSAWSCIK